MRNQNKQKRKKSAERTAQRVRQIRKCWKLSSENYQMKANVKCLCVDSPKQNLPLKLDEDELELPLN